jgi:hypothetical protein
MKVLYFNDESKDITVHVIGQTANYFDKLAPQECKLYELDAPVDAIFWVKKWDQQVILLSWVSPAVVAQLPVHHNEHKDLK